MDSLPLSHWGSPPCLSFRFAIESIFQENRRYGDFPGDPVVKTCCFQCNTAGFVPGEGTKIPHTMRCCQENVKKEEDWRHREKGVICGFWSSWPWLGAKWHKRLGTGEVQWLKFKNHLEGHFWCTGKRMGCGIRKSELKAWFNSSFSVWSWAGYVAPLGLRFLIRKNQDNNTSQGAKGCRQDEKTQILSIRHSTFLGLLPSPGSNRV